MKLNKLLYISLFLPLFSSCSLDREPYGLNNLWSSEENAQKALDAAYVPLYEEEGFGEGHWWAGLLSDDMVINREDAAMGQLSNFTAVTNTYWAMYDNWKVMYKVIRRANDVLANVPNIEMAESKKRIMLGEANYLCAFSYFFLAKRYGGLPFYDYNNPTEFNKPRETKEQTYKNIETYLLNAIEYFRDIDGQPLWERTSDDWGRPNLGAAYGLLAKVYAHWGKMDKCKEMAWEVINSGKYSLEKANDNGFDYLFSPAGEKSNEVLFNLTQLPERHKCSIISVVPMSSSLTGGTGWFYFAPTQSLRDAFKEGDLRRKTTVAQDGDEYSWIGKTFVLKTNPKEQDRQEIEAEGKTLGNINDMTTGYMCVKYANAYSTMSGWVWEPGADVPLLRYSDVLLLYVEALMNEKGLNSSNRDAMTSDATILKYFNEVHERAFAKTPGYDHKDQINFMDLVNERRCELAYEDERHYDLVRWEMAKEVYAQNDKDKGARTFDPAKHRHMPLPQSEIENSNGVLINNPAPGYSDFGSAQ